jgi:hypothetical protein
MHTEKFLLYGQLLQWDRAAQEFQNLSEGTADYQKIVMMRAHHRTMTTLLESSVAPNETHLDASQWAFEDIVTFIGDLAGRCKKSHGANAHSDDESASDSETSTSYTFDESNSSTLSTSSTHSRPTTPLPRPCHADTPPKKIGSPPFVLDAGIIFSLFWTAVKCRDGLIRRRAIALLELSWQEGIWIGMIQAAIAKRVVEIEEEQPYEQNPDVHAVKTAADVRDAVRILNVGSDVDKVMRRVRVVLMRRSIVERLSGCRVEGEEEFCEEVEWVYW